MGVPRFFSWITRRYPMILEDMEQYPLPEIDCLYLDMNGIIYKCSKDESIIFKAQVMSRQMEQIWFSIFNYINAIVDSINPKKLLFLGLDGVAPRAKMNNQRSRRFRSAKDYKQLERKLEHYGDIKNQEQFKNNCITPGTQFMLQLNRQLRFFISKKIEEDPKWRKFNVIFSGADVPGEGQHKIMDFIRQCTKLNVYDDTATHCLYGADADLIMLAMSLKVKKMCIIREEFTMKSKRVVISKARNLKTAKFKIIYVNILKEYFDLEYKRLKDQMKIPYDSQRILNDFVFLCFFIGNDFLPRCYCYDIREGNLEVLIQGFKKFLKVCEDYIIHQDHINLKELERLTKILSEFESMFIGDRSDETHKAYKASRGDAPQSKSEMKEFEKDLIDNITLTSERLRTEEQFLLKMKTLYMNDAKQAKNMFYEVKLKFSPAKQPEKLNQLLDHYVQGLHYVYQYYFGGLPSWQWYYPYYYAPLVADLHVYLSYLNSAQIQLKPFNKSQPYEPFKQLMCILPQESVQLLPKCLQHLIEDEQSPLITPINYFPENVEIDPYGGLQEHEFINILPFIDQHKITEVYNSIPQDKFTPQQLARNQFFQNELYQADPKALTKVRSFYSQISDFSARMTITLLDFKTDDVLKLQKIAEPLTDLEAKLQFPTLYIQQFTSEVAFGYNQDRRIDIILKTKPQNEDINFKLGSEVYFGYPYQSHGRVMAIATEKEFRCVKEFRIMDFIHDADMIESDFKEDRDYWKESRKQCVIKGLKLPGSKIYFLCHSEINHRKHNGEYARSFLANTSLDLTVDAALVSQKPKYAFTQILYKPKDMYEEFKHGEEVVILKGNRDIKDNKGRQYTGSKGIVVDYDEQYREVLVKITDLTIEIPEKILRTINTSDFLFSVKFVANILQINLQILLDVLDSVQVILDDDQVSARGMPKSLDIGLNFIKRNEKKLVPSLARLPGQGVSTGNLFKVFCDLEISGIAVNLICDYKKEFPQVFTFLDIRMNNLIAKSKNTGRTIDWREEIAAGDVYPHEKDPNIPITRLYIWLLKKEEIHMPNAAMNSKAVSKQKLADVLKYFKEMRRPSPPTNPIAFDPNCLYSRRLSEKGVPHLSKDPQAHAIADRIICMHQAYFGQRAVIVGIDNNEYDVLFERPSFGKNDLGGKVDYLWGGKFEYCELYNMDTWPDLIEPRFVNGSLNKITIKRCWDGQAPEFVAKFKGAAVNSLKDYKLLVSTVNLPYSTLEEFMNKQDKDEFQVVVDKRNRHRTFYPKDDEKKLIDDVIKGGADLKKIVNEFATKKEATLTQALEEQEIKQAKAENEQRQVKKTKQQEKKDRSKVEAKETPDLKKFNAPPRKQLRYIPKNEYIDRVQQNKLKQSPTQKLGPVETRPAFETKKQPAQQQTIKKLQPPKPRYIEKPQPPVPNEEHQSIVTSSSPSIINISQTPHSEPQNNPTEQISQRQIQLNQILQQVNKPTKQIKLAEVETLELSQQQIMNPKKDETSKQEYDNEIFN